MNDEKKQKIINICFISAGVIIALLVVKMVWGQEVTIKRVPIEERIETRIKNEVEMNFSLSEKQKKEKKQEIVDEEIQNNIVKIPIVQISYIKIPLIDIPVLKVRYIDIDTIEIDVSTLNIVQIKRIIFYLGQVAVRGSVQYRDGKITVVEEKKDKVFWKWSTK